MSEVVVVIGAGSIGQAVARRVSAGKQVVLGDLHRGNADTAAEVMRDAGFDVSTATVDVSSRESVHALAETATTLGEVTGVIHAAGVSPSQASPATILAVDLYGTALVLEEFGNVIARGGAGVVIASQSGHRLGALSPDQNAALATTPADELLKSDRNDCGTAWLTETCCNGQHSLVQLTATNWFLRRRTRTLTRTPSPSRAREQFTSPEPHQACREPG